MSKLVVESNWLLDSFGTPKELREQALVDLAMEGIQFLTPAQEQAMNNPATQFAERMEDLLRSIADTDCYAGGCQDCGGIGYKNETELDLILADIQKAKGDETKGVVK